MLITGITLFLPVLSAFSLCKQFGHTSGPTERPGLEPSCLTLIIFLKEFFNKHNFEKNQQTPQNHTNLPSIQRGNYALKKFFNLIFFLLQHESSNITNSAMNIYIMVLNVRKPVFGGLRTTKAQTSLCIRTV